MPTLNWSALPVTESDAPVLIMASRFRLSSRRYVLRFLLDALKIRKQVRQSDGAVGVALIARPLAREFFTLSAWRDRAALSAMVRVEPHRSVMQRYHSAMAESRFEFWEMSPHELPPRWADAKRRLG